MNLAQVLALPVAIYGTAATLFARKEQAAHRPPISWRRKVKVGLAMVLFGAFLPACGWFWYDRYADLGVHFGASFRLSEHDSDTVVPKLARPGWGGDLTFTPVLTAVSNLGDCVLPARLLITPVVDGQRLFVREVRHNVEVAIAIPDNSVNVELEISLVEPGNQECILDVTLARPVLRRSLW